MIRARALQGREPDGVSLAVADVAVDPGTVWGLLGPEAADRSLLLQILGGIRPPDGGTAVVLGLDVERQAAAVRRRAAFLPREKEAFLELRAGELLRFYLGFFPGASDPDDLLGRAGIEAGLRLGKASPAQRSRLLLEAVLARSAELLLLDEPTADLDPAAAEVALAALVEGAGPGGRGIVLASSRIDEVQRICDRVAIMVDGRLVLDGRVDRLLDQWSRGRVDADLRLAHELEGTPGVRITGQRGEHLELVTDDFPALRPRLAGRPGLQVQPMSLREIYLEVVARAA